MAPSPRFFLRPFTSVFSAARTIGFIRANPLPVLPPPASPLALFLCFHVTAIRCSLSKLLEAPFILVAISIGGSYGGVSLRPTLSKRCGALVIILTFTIFPC